ncbi:MAG: hypothetical protein IJN74_03855 [Clostridia bacterium]|nr:hypothetical protein [Clostridia bacterium]
MAKIKVDSGKKLGKIKPMHAVGGAPMGAAEGFSAEFHYLTEAGIPYSRLHDIGGAFGGNAYVDVPNIFRDFDADVDDPMSYDFAFTDRLIEELEKAGVEPYYRLGVTIENNAMVKAYRIDPPKDYDKWAKICEHIIAHYIDGWADGYHYDIKYWEIWNEADDGERISQMWNGTKEDYYRLYEVSAKHLKGVFGDRIKIGGYGAISLRVGVAPEEFTEKPRAFYFLDFFKGFLKHVQETGTPLDFFSWHGYNNTVDKMVAVAHFVRKELDAHGFTNTESHLNEWNIFHNQAGTAHHGAGVCGMMLAMQKAPLDLLAFYIATAGSSRYSGLFKLPWCTPIHAYYAMVTFNHLYQLGTEVESTCDTENVYVCAASNGKKTALVISNLCEWPVKLEIEGVDFSDAKCYLMDETRLLSWSPRLDVLPKNGVFLVEF